jgi:hypothetical protein
MARSLLGRARALLPLAVAAVHDAGAGSTPGAGDERGGIVEPIFDAGSGLAQGWADYGWTPHELQRGGPASLDLADYGGLVLARPGLSGSYGGLVFRYRAPDSFGDFLEVRLESAAGKALGRVHVPRTRGVTRPDGFTEVWIPMGEVNPGGEPFERVVFHAHRRVGRERVLLDGVGLTAAPPPRPSPARSASFVVACGAPGHAISPFIYGMAGSADEPAHVWALGATARRWGGNPTSRYNWELGNAWSTNHNWFFRNARVSPRPDFDHETFLEENRKHGVRTALTVPMLGWVAKDTTSYSFPVSVFGPQQATAWDLPDAGNGISPDGRPIPPGPPTRTSVPSTPGSVERWVRQIRERDRTRGRSVHQYILDNEPGLWHETHRDVHPDPASYDELLEKTIAYAAAIRRADPEAVIAGPAEWGWLGYNYSGEDKVAGIQARPDRRAHGDVPLIPWYLRKIREHEQKTGTRILDVLDVHYYPAIPGMGEGTGGDVGPAMAALRIRSTRSLWDPSYTDESWIKERLRLLPLLRQWVQQNHPGLGISIGEWNFGAETHMSGGLAAAEVLGRFGTEGLTSAYYWAYPADRSPAFWAFRAYRNFDGSGGSFQDWSIPVKGQAPLSSIFASRDGDRRRVVAVLLNFDPASPLRAHLAVSDCGRIESARGFTYAGGASGFRPLDPAREAGAVDATVEPYSITVVDLTMAQVGR